MTAIINIQHLCCNTFFSESLLSLLGVGILWGATNPFLKRTSKGVENIKADNAFSQFISEIVFLFSNWKVREYNMFIIIALPEEIGHFSIVISQQLPIM